MVETIVLDPGERWEKDLKSGETFENKIIDQSADGAFAQIDAEGSNWTIRNVGFKGKAGGNGKNDTHLHLEALGGTCVAENVYMGDGTQGKENRMTAVWVSNRSYGTVKIRNLYVEDYGDNAIYGSDPGHPSLDGQGAEVHIENCYVKDVNISAYRLGTPGSYVKNSVADLAGDIDGNNRGQVKSRGMYAKHSGGISVENCDFKCHKGPVVQTRDGAQVTLDNCRWDIPDSDYRYGDGMWIPGNGAVHHSGSAGAPDLSVPPGVPTSSTSAANGGGVTGEALASFPLSLPSVTASGRSSFANVAIGVGIGLLVAVVLI